MNTSTALVAILGIIISILLLKRQGKSKKWPIIALIIFILLFVGSFSNSSKTQKDSTPVSSNKTVTKTDNVSATKKPMETETLNQTNTYTSAPKNTTKPTEEIKPTKEVIPTETITATIEISTQTVPESETTSKENSKEEPKQFTLSWNDPGEFGEEITLNKGTNTATTFIAFRVPAGFYSVKNRAERGASQVTVYSDIIKNGQNEELSNENCPFPIVVMAGKDPQELEIKEGQFIKLSDKSSNIEFILQE